MRNPRIPEDLIKMGLAKGLRDNTNMTSETNIRKTAGKIYEDVLPYLEGQKAWIDMDRFHIGRTTLASADRETFMAWFNARLLMGLGMSRINLNREDKQRLLDLLARENIDVTGEG